MSRTDNRIGKYWTAGVNARIQSEQSGNGLGGYHIPMQHTINSQISYEVGSWNVTGAVHNVTNRDNWIHNGDFYGDNVVISRELPIRASVFIIKKF